MAERRPVDHDLRRRVAGDLGTTFLVEASAGTGKTSILVERYVACLLATAGDDGAPAVGEVAAITFTEKAAGELRQRIRERLEGLDDAPVHTIHGFAARLLREHAVLAGIDPAFEQLDQLGSDIARQRLWEEWLTLLAAGDGDGGGAAGDGGGVAALAEAGMTAADLVAAVRRLLRAGVSLAAVRDLAVGSGGVFDERYDLAPAGLPRAPDLRASLAACREPAESLLRFCDEACLDEADRACTAARDLAAQVLGLCADPPADDEELAGRLFALRLPTVKGLGGRKENWDEAQGGKAALQDCYGAFRDAVEAVRRAYGDFVSGLALAVADAFARWAGERQAAAGQLDFTDLLGRLRDLLLHDLGARRRLQRRFRFLLVDEFQDTDPLQAEIVLFLCEREPRAAAWHEVELEPGKLFLVGDPKQSIYRFRRADIALYDAVARLVADQPGGRGQVVRIRQNFRTTPSLVAWVNRVFSHVFAADAEPGRQPAYVPVEAFRDDVPGPAVSVVLGGEYGQGAACIGDVAAARQDEAAALAALLLEMHEGGAGGRRWLVAGGGGGGGGLRPPRWGEVAVLLRTTTAIEVYEEALREAGVPFRSEGGSTYYERREVADALLCLRAAYDPGDGPAVYGALHSTFFACSDDDLLRFRADGGRFDPLAGERPPGHEAVAAGLDLLADLHRLALAAPAHEVLAELLRRTHAVEALAAAGGGAAQAVANLEQLVARARAFARAGGGGVSAFLRWAARAGEAAGEQDAPLDAGEGEGAVRLLTVHKAKGLEFPVVVIAGGALGGSGSGRGGFVDRARRRYVAQVPGALPGAGKVTFAPGDHEALKAAEEQMQASELRRLLYVAATRARDHLVITCFGQLVGRDRNREPRRGVLLAPLAAHLPSLGAGPPDEPYVHGDVLVLPPAGVAEVADSGEGGGEPDVAGLLAARETWRAAREAVLARAARPAPVTSPSSLEHLDDEARVGGPGAPPGRTDALALGTLVHAVMERCDLRDGSSLAAVAAAEAARVGRPDLAQAAAAQAGAGWRSAPVRAAAASPRVYRELPVGLALDGVVLSGSVDLLYRDGDAWVVVDYKTDRGVGPDVLRQRYTTQGAAYALAVEAALDEPVAAVVFVAAALDGLAVTVPVDDALRDLARREIAAAAAAGRPLDGGLTPEG